MTSAEPSEGTSSTSDADRMVATESAVNILAQGKRNMVCGEIPTAVNQFQEACKILAKAYGETAKECADAYFCYGQALLDLARMENGVLGNALQGVPDTDEDESSEKSDQFEKVEMEAEEREKLRQEVYDAMSDKEKAEADAKKAEADAKKAGETVEVAMETGNQDDSSKQTDEKKVTDTDKGSSDKNKEKPEQDKEAKKSEDKAETSEKKEETKEESNKEEKSNDKAEKEAKPDAKAEKEAKPDAKAVKEAKPDAKAVKEAKPDAKAEKEAKPDAKAEKEAKPDAKAEKEAKPDAKAEKDLPDKENKDKNDSEEKDVKENKEKKEKSEGGSEDKESEEGEEKEGEESMEEGGTEEEEEGDDTAEDVSQDESPDAENPDDVSNLQLAWEMLELAKLIYAKDQSKEARLRTAESHLKLGEVSMETEQYEEAVKDFNECLTIQKDILEPDNRLLAETYYQLGLAYCFAKNFDESVASYQAAIKCIESRITKLDEVLAKATTEEKESKDFDSPVYKAKKEVDDLKELLPDIKSKIDDCEDERKNMDQLKNLAKEALGGLASSSAPATEKSEPAQEDVKTTDISHLVKRKRKSEDNEEDKSKKARQEDGAGDAPVTNGHAEKEESKTAAEAKS